MCVLIVQWSSQYFNQPHWEGKGEERCYITHSPLLCFFPSLCFFDISLFNYILKSIIQILGIGLHHDFLLFAKVKKKKKVVVVAMADHVLSVL